MSGTMTFANPRRTVNHVTGEKRQLGKDLLYWKLKDGKVFETNIGGTPLEFNVGKGKVIKGFENAVIGMNAGETRTVTIKPADGYGAKGRDLIWVVVSSELPAGITLAL